MTVNVHDLVDLPHGEATKELKKKGHWKPLEGELAKYNVTVRKEYKDYKTAVIQVEAISEDEAREFAVEDALMNDDEAAEATAGKVVLV